MIAEGKKSLTFRENMFLLFFMFPFSEWRMSPTIQWDIFLSVNGYLDFIKPLQLHDLPRVITVVTVLFTASKIFLREKKLRCFTEVLLLHCIV